MTDIPIPDEIMQMAKAAFFADPYEAPYLAVARALMAERDRALEDAAVWHDGRAAELRKLGLFHAESLAAENEKSATAIRAMKGKTDE